MADPPKFKLSTTNSWVISDEKGNTIKSSSSGDPARPTINFKLVASGLSGVLYANEAPLLIRLLELTIEHTDSTPTEVELE